MHPTINNQNSTHQTWFSKPWNWLVSKTRGEVLGNIYDFLEPGFSGFGGVLVAIVEKKPAWFLNENSPWWDRLFICGIILIFFGVFFLILNSRIKQKLKKLNDKLNIDLAEAKEELSESKIQYENKMQFLNGKREELLYDILSALFESCGFKEEERISVYRFDDFNGKDEFVLLLRYARQRNLKKPNSKSKAYENNSTSVIGRAWSHGRFFISNLPDPAVDETAYRNALQAEGIMVSDNHFTNMRMKCRTYLSLAVKDKRTRTNTAVIVFESLREAAFQEENIIRIFENFSALTESLTEHHIQTNPDPTI